MRAKAVLIFICLLTVSLKAYGQTGFGTIAGQVTDPSGAAVPGAKVTVTNVDTNVSRGADTNATGYYEIMQLMPGPYALRVEMTGFKTLQRSGIKLQVADRLTIDLQLQVGETRETVTVVGEAPRLRTQDAQTGEVINSTMIQTLPQLNRDPLQLLLLSANVQGNGSRAGYSLTTGTSDTRINGGRTQGIEYYVDGVVAGTGRAHGVADITPTMDTVAEFKVITNGISAEYGRLSGGAVELVSRSGTNKFHGQAFDYIQNDVLNATSWNQNRLNGHKTPFRRNNFGGVVGGPIWKDRTFFFFNYDGMRFVQSGQLNVASLPTAAERNGDFSQTLVRGTPTTLYDPDGPVVGGVRQLLLGADPLDPCTPVGQCVPQDRISPVSAAILSFVPLPNRAPAANSSFIEDYVGASSTKENWNTWGARLDHVFTQNTRIFGKFSRRGWDTAATRWRGPLQAIPHNFMKGGFGLTLHYTWSVSPTLLFDVGAGGLYNPLTVGSTLADDFTATSIPFDAVTASLLGAKAMPWVWATGMDAFSDAPAFQVNNSTSYDVTPSLVKVLNRHTLKFGYEHRRYYDNFEKIGAGNDSHFVFQQNPVYRLAGDHGWTDENAANVMGAYLLGTNDWATIAGNSTRAMNLNYHAAYVQDTYKVSNKLTLNLGLRWDMETPTTERHDKLYFWDANAPSMFTIKPGYDFSAAVTAAGLDPSQVQTPSWTSGGFAPGAIRIANTPEFTQRYGTKYYPWQFAPRFGFAYGLNSKTVLRGSFGLMYLSSTGDPGGLSRGGTGVGLADQANAGWHRGITEQGSWQMSTFDNPFLPLDITRYERDTAVANFQATGGDPGPSAFSRDSRQPREWTWNLGIQREVPGGFLVEANYSANRGVGLLGQDLISKFPKSLFVPENEAIYTTPVESPIAEPTRYGDTERLAYLEFLYPYYGATTVLGVNLGRSNYQSLNLRAERRGRGLNFLANYTLGWMNDNVGGPDSSDGCMCVTGTGSKSFQSVDTLRDIYGPSVLDERHRLTVFFNYQLPFGRGKRWLGNTEGRLDKTILDQLVGGWEISSITTWRSGRPVVIANSNLNNDIRVETTFSRYATSDQNIGNATFAGNSGVFFAEGDSQPAASARRFDASKVLEPGRFIYGNLAVYDGIRQPSRVMHSQSLMKKFPIFSPEGTRYLQFRMEAENFFNLRGMANYITDPRDSGFGTIRVDNNNALYNTERRIQVSLRFVF
jgi:hypothetical protein